MKGRQLYREGARGKVEEDKQGTRTVAKKKKQGELKFEDKRYAWEHQHVRKQQKSSEQTEERNLHCVCVCVIQIRVPPRFPRGRGSHGVRSQHPVQGDVPGAGQGGRAGAP